MKKKYLGIMLSVIIVGGIATGAIYSNDNNNKDSNSKLNVQHLDFNYINQKSNLKELISSSDLIVKGKVTKITPIEVHKVIFTDYEIDVNNVLKGKKQNIVVRLTGGTLDNTELIADGIKPLDKDQEYIFCLEKVFPKDEDSNIFSPIGAYQGIFAVDSSTSNKSTTGSAVNLLSTGKVKIKEFNKSNVIENAMVGKEFDETKDFK